MLINNKRAFSPVVASIILVAVAVAVSIAVAAWITGFTFSFANEEELQFSDTQWGINGDYVELTLRNGGTADVVLDSLKVNGHVTEYTIVSGSQSIKPGETSTVRVTYEFVVGNKYSFIFSTANGYNFGSYSTADLP
jgi:flagellin-like protein